MATFMVDRSSHRGARGDLLLILAFIACGAAVTAGGMAVDHGQRLQASALIVVALLSAGWIALRQRAAIEQALVLASGALRRFSKRSIAG